MYLIDKLYQAVAEKGHVCVGLDTSAEYIPEKERSLFSSDADAILAYNKIIIDATFDIAACYKVQIACYEELGIAGLTCYARTLEYLRKKDCLIIADIKRGDIADTAKRYAKAHFEGEFEADFVTLSPYMGMDSIEPWLEWTEKKGKGAFVIMRTTNKGRNDFEYLEVNAGSAGPGRRLYDIVGDKISELASRYMGNYGYGAIGAVVGADPKTPPEIEEAKAIRNERKNLFFLMPGYGAQGGAASDAALLLRNGNGGIINASRSIIKAWSLSLADKNNADNEYAASAARNAAITMRDALRKAAG